MCFRPHFEDGRSQRTNMRGKGKKKQQCSSFPHKRVITKVLSDQAVRRRSSLITNRIRWNQALKSRGLRCDTQHDTQHDTRNDTRHDTRSLVLFIQSFVHSFIFSKHLLNMKRFILSFCFIFFSRLWDTATARYCSFSGRLSLTDLTNTGEPVLPNTLQGGQTACWHTAGFVPNTPPPLSESQLCEVHKGLGDKHS